MRPCPRWSVIPGMTLSFGTKEGTEGRPSPANRTYSGHNEPARHDERSHPKPSPSSTAEPPKTPSFMHMVRTHTLTRLLTDTRVRFVLAHGEACAWSASRHAVTLSCLHKITYGYARTVRLSPMEEACARSASRHAVTLSRLHKITYGYARTVRLSPMEEACARPASRHARGVRHIPTVRYTCTYDAYAYAWNCTQSSKACICCGDGVICSLTPDATVHNHDEHSGAKPRLLYSCADSLQTAARRA
jgi:DNA-binding Xre family transcriptional regulator